MCTILKNPTLKSSVAFSTNVKAWFHDTAWSHQRKAATLYMSKSASRAAHRTSVSASSTDAGSEAALVDGLLFASISSEPTSTRQNFRMGQAISTFLLPCCFPRSVQFLYIRFIGINGTTGQHTHVVRTHHYMYGQQQWSNLRVNSGADITFIPQALH